MVRLLKNLEKYFIFAGVLLFAIFVLPKFSSPYIVPKEIFGGVVIAAVLIFWCVRAIVKGEATFAIGKFDLGIVLVAIVYILSAVIKTPNKMEAFFFSGTSTFVIISAIYYFLANQLDKKSKSSLLVSIFASGILLAISVLFTQLGIFAKIPQLPSFMKDASFNPIGGNLPSAIYLLALLPIGAALIIKEKDLVKRIFYAVSSAVIVFGLVMLISTLLPGKSQAITFPTFQTSWEVAVETLKQSPIWGIGSGNYLTAFNLYRSVTYNQTTLWLVRFSTATNFYFTAITELGFAGLAAFVVLIISIYKKFAKDMKSMPWEELSVVILLVIFAVFPSSPALFFLFTALLAVFSGSEEKNITLANTRVPAVIISIPVFIGVIALAIFGAKAVMAEVTYKKSLDALTGNNAKLTYDLMTQATVKSPYVDRYHASLAQIDMALATSIAAKKDLTDTDRSTVTQLVQQAINEGKATVSLNPQRSGNWEVLAQIYRSIMSFAQGADQFTIQAYTQAVSFDPTNPNLRIALGGVYYALGNYDSAIDAFKLAVLTKQDLANAHYNLAIAYREKKDYANAVTEMNTVLSLLKPDSPDYALAKTTLDEIQKKVPVTKAQGESLTTPQPSQTTITPPISLPSN